jgi:DNA mismatch repair protein MutS
VLELTEARHPVLDSSMRDRFVPNDCALGTPEQTSTLALITGPNMAGKSTYIRQTALVVLLAQAGSFVPATRARIGVVDRIFTRIGASDELHAGRSTFMVEMTETANILHHATDRSLVVLDEIGRGTSTLDGLSLAWAITEHLAERGARTLFATHYHELTSIPDRLPTVTNLHVSVREWQDRIVFLHRIQPGRTNQSYGIHVAELAGLPVAAIQRARELLATLEVREGDTAAKAAAISSAPVIPPSEQMSLFTEFLPHPAIEELRGLDLDAMTPLEAFDRLRELAAKTRGAGDA